MVVTIPKIAQHDGYEGNLITISIDDKCPKCGAKRGTKIWSGFSYDGSRRLSVDCWLNECSHIDKYEDVMLEYLNAKNIKVSHHTGAPESDEQN